MITRSVRLGMVILLASSAWGCIEPQDRRPGTRLSGEVVSEPVSDWSFANEIQEVHLETKTWYLVPHSVTTVCVGVGENLYVPSVYFEGGAWPNKYWNSNVDRDPRVRIRIGDKIYPREAVVVEDPEERKRALGALAAKYPFWRDQMSKPDDERFDMALLRMDPPRD